MKAYTLKQKKNTKELHLFEGDFTNEGCTSSSESICGKMKKNDSAGNVFTCETEDDARKLCAKQGRAVCGTCVSHLYATYDD